MFGIAARHAVDRAQLADAVRGDQGGEPADACVAVSSVGGPQFAGCADPLHARMCQDLVEHAKVVVAGHPEQVGHTQAVQTVEEMAGDGRVG